MNKILEDLGSLYLIELGTGIQSLFSIDEQHGKSMKQIFHFLKKKDIYVEETNTKRNKQLQTN